MSPYEWSFPYHHWMIDELDKDMQTRLHLPAGETMHLAHSLMQLVQGYMTGSNSRKAQKSRNWDYKCLLKNNEGQSVVVNFCARLEFQDGKRKDMKHNYNPDGATSRNHGRGA
eukprot:7764916-Karenia_brevis.AAC.1